MKLAFVTLMTIVSLVYVILTIQVLSDLSTVKPNVQKFLSERK